MSRIRWKRSAWGAVSWLFLTVLVVACGGTAPQPQQQTTSELARRVLVTNQFASRVNIVDADTDRVSTFTVSGGANPTIMAVSADKRRTLIFSAFNNGVATIDNDTEDSLGQVFLPGLADSLVAGNDGTRGYAAVRNAGVVVVIDTTNRSTTTVAVPAVRRLVLSPNGARLLAFADDSDSVTVIDTSNNSATVVSGFDRPVSAVFNSDSTIAYILNCGPECGGASASVQELLMAGNTLGNSVNVSAATVGLLNGGNLFVAGSAGGAGLLDVVNVPALTVARSGIAVGDGFHHTMALGSNNKLFIAARTCVNCLTILNTSGNTAVIRPPNGEVQALQPIAGRDVVYVVEDDELVIYDTSTDAPQAFQLSFVGQIVDVKSID
ncbi:MAG: YncE family protein [Acidobacteria bacterium]|nr:YncE family protein [Acidobacteriota bacterium]